MVVVMVVVVVVVVLSLSCWVGWACCWCACMHACVGVWVHVGACCACLIRYMHGVYIMVVHAAPGDEPTPGLPRPLLGGGDLIRTLAPPSPPNECI